MYAMMLPLLFLCENNEMNEAATMEEWWIGEEMGSGEENTTKKKMSFGK